MSDINKKKKAVQKFVKQSINMIEKGSKNVEMLKSTVYMLRFKSITAIGQEAVCLLPVCGRQN